jgi:hypothetical protein
MLRVGDLDGLVREIDALSAREDWDGVLGVRDACLRATEESGLQLWGAAQFADYRVALDAPASLAASVVTPGAARFGLGPLTEVVAQNHAFAELAAHLDPTVRAIVAQERVLRGEDLRGREDVDVEDLTPPLRLEPFEPSYALPTYRPGERSDGGPDIVATGPTEVVTDVPDADEAAHPLLLRALRDLVEPWTSQSTGVVRLAVVEGDIARAVAHVAREASGPVHVQRVRAADALAVVAFAAASGGVHGRRRGGAAGRSSAWWLAAVAAGLDEVAPDGTIDADALEFRLEDLELALFDVPSAGGGTWSLRVALADPEAGWAAAIDATDDASDDAGDDASVERGANEEGVR